jgi:hypothetical protein
MAQLMKDKAPDLKIAFGFDHESIAFLMALVLELSIIGVVIYQVLYIANDALLSAVRYENKTLNWNVNPHHTANLSLEHSPAPDVVSLPYFPQVGFGGTNPPALVSTQSSVPVHRAQPSLEPRAHGTHGLQTTHGYAGLNDANLALPEKQDELFDLWVQKLKSGELNPSSRDTRDFINEHRLATGIKLISGLADSWLVRAENIGVLTLNPTQKNGVPKYILAGDKPKALSLEKGRDE